MPLDSNRVPLEPGILAAVNPVEDARPARDPYRSWCQSPLDPEAAGVLDGGRSTDRLS
jgi:hypothetical protein